MKATILAALALSAVGGFASAATFSDIQTSGKEKTTNVCGTQSCAQSTLASISISGALDISQLEQAELLSDTTVQIDYQGYVATYNLGDDPNFQDGDTSVKFATSDLGIVGATGTVSSNLQWANGVLQFSGKYTLNMSANVPHDTDPRPLLLKSGTKHHEGQPVIYNTPLKVLIRRGGNNVINISAMVHVDQKYSNKGLVTADGGGSSQDSVSIVSKSWLPIP